MEGADDTENGIIGQLLVPSAEVDGVTHHHQQHGQCFQLVYVEDSMIVHLL